MILKDERGRKKGERRSESEKGLGSGEMDREKGWMEEVVVERVRFELKNGSYYCLFLSLLFPSKLESRCKQKSNS